MKPAEVKDLKDRGELGRERPVRKGGWKRPRGPGKEGLALG